MNRRRALLWLLLLVSTGCGRCPGPHDSEVGKITWWLRIEGGERGEQQCAISGAHRSYALVDSMPYMPGYAWYINYELSPGRGVAVAWQCLESDWTDCTRRDDVVWVVDGHDLVLRRDPDATELGGDGCRVDAVLEGRFTDKGTKGTFVETLSFTFDGDDASCERVEASYREADPTGQGLRDCRFTYAYPFVFSHVAVPR